MAGMMSVVLDANVIVSVFVNPPVPPAQVLNTWPQHPESSK